MNIVFDYIYYRMTKFYFKWDGKEGITAIIGIGMIQGLLVADIIIFFSKLYMDRSDTSPYAQQISFAFAALTAIMIFINYLRYNGKYDILSLKWDKETKSQSYYRGVMVLLALILPWVPIVVIGAYW